MICRYKIHDQETNEVLIAVGDNIQFFESMGYTEVGEVERAYDGRYFVVGHAPTMPQEEVVIQVRAERNRRLAETDWYMMPDYPSNPQNLEELKVYRQALRDVPKQEGFPRDVRWPDVPKFLCKDSESEPLGLAKVGI
jgi:hypothetical protein